MLNFENLSIVKKIIIIQLFITIVAIVICSVSTVISDIHIFRKMSINKLFLTAKIIGNNSVSAMLFLDNETATETLRSLQVESNIVCAAIFDEQGNVFAFYNKNGEDEFSITKIDFSKPYYFASDYISLLYTIKHDGETLGTLYLKSDMEILHETINKYIKIILVVFVLTLLISFLLIIFMQKTISSPLIQLVKNTNQVSKTGDYSIRAKKYGNNELGDLYDSFNGMMTQIQKRDKAIKEAHDKLEDRVNERTVELQKEMAERKKTEEKLLKAKSEAEAANRAKSEFLDNLSQEIRTTMNAVIGMTSLW